MSESEENPKGEVAEQPKVVVRCMEPPVVQVQSARMLRSPSHESVTTELSLFSVSSLASGEAKGSSRLSSFKSYSEAQLSAGRGPSPSPESRLRVQTAGRPADIPEALHWLEEDSELIVSCGKLASALGLRKSFSASDVTQLPGGEVGGSDRPLRSAVSSHGLDLGQRDRLLLEQARLEQASRSCSTWVAVGDAPGASQLPSPQGARLHPGQHLGPPTFTPADLVRSVNKKLRQSYIRRRLLTTYRALERLSQSEFNLDRLEAAAAAASAARSIAPHPALMQLPEHALTLKDLERQRGKQLSKYERNMMIFNWLHTLDDQAPDAALH